MCSIAIKELKHVFDHLIFTEDSSTAPFSLALHPYRAANRSLRVKALINSSKRLSSSGNTIMSIWESKKPEHPT